MTPPPDQPYAGRIEGREHILPVRVYYEDTDLTGVVYHGAYVRFFERGRSDFLRLAGVRHAELSRGPDPYAFAVTNLAIAFKRAARMDDALQVRTRYEALRGPRVIIAQSISRAEELLAEAQVEVVCVDLAGRARRPPTDLVNKVKVLLPTSP